MGAGLSGLTAALVLERNGIKPYIFEKRSEVGDRFVNCEIMLSILSSPVDDEIKYLAEKHSIFLKPQNNISKLIINSENEKAVITGRLGFINLRGRTHNSLEKQLAEQVKSKIIFNSEFSYQKLSQEFSHLLLATGDGAYAEKLNNYKKNLTVTLKGAMIKGNFSPDTVYAWLNNKLAPGGYCYLIPVDKSKANIVIAFPDHCYQGNIDILWNNFTTELKKELKKPLEIISSFQIRKYIIGISPKPHLGNTYFVGNNYGSIMPFLGFGQFSAILTGIYATYDILGKKNYQKQLKPLKKSYSTSYTLRKFLEMLDNKKYDFLVKKTDSNLGNKFFNSRFNLLQLGSILLKPYTKLFYSKKTIK